MIRQVCQAVLALSFLVSVSVAQSGGDYRIEKFVTNSGGTISGGSYSIDATAGQNSAGPRQTGDPYILNTGFWVPEFAPTAASVSISGRVMTSSGVGVLNAIVTIADSHGQARIARSSSFGYYFIEELQVGQTYVITVSSKSHQFVPRVVTIIENLSDFDFAALP